MPSLDTTKAPPLSRHELSLGPSFHFVISPQSNRTAHHHRCCATRQDGSLESGAMNSRRWPTNFRWAPRDHGDPSSPSRRVRSWSSCRRSCRKTVRRQRPCRRDASRSACRACWASRCGRSLAGPFHPGSSPSPDCCWPSATRPRLLAITTPLAFCQGPVPIRSRAFTNFGSFNAGACVLK